MGHVPDLDRPPPSVPQSYCSPPTDTVPPQADLQCKQAIKELFLKAPPKEDMGKYYTLKFYNITCYGPNAHSHIFAEDSDIQCIVEHHMPITSTFDLQNMFSIRGYRIFNNPARQSHMSAEGTHGGELIACKKYHNITQIDKEVFDLLESIHKSRAALLLAFYD